MKRCTKRNNNKQQLYQEKLLAVLRFCGSGESIICIVYVLSTGQEARLFLLLGSVFTSCLALYAFSLSGR